MKINKLKLLFPAMLVIAISPIYAADVISEPGADSPWDKRMGDVTGLFGTRIKGSAVNDAKAGVGYSSDTFTPFQTNQTKLVGAYGSTEVGVGCNGLNLGTVIDGQIGQYAGMVEQFIQQAPSLAIMYLAYSQPTVKSVIDQLNTVGQFGLDMSNLTCSGVRQKADLAYEQKKQELAEADCTAEAGYKSTECMTGEGITGSLIKTAGEMKAKVSDRAKSLMGSVSSASGGLIGVKGSGGSSGGSGSGSGSGSSGGGTGSGSSGGSGGSGSSGSGGGGSGGGSAIASKSCSNPNTEGTRALVLASSELGCDDIKKYSGLIPSYSSQDGATTVEPRTTNLETLSKEMTTDYMDIYHGIYTQDRKDFQQSKEFKDLVNKADIVVTDSEYTLMRGLAKNNPALFASTQRNLATLAMMKELDGVISKIEIGVSTGVANQPDGQLLSPENVARTNLSVEGLRKEYDALKAKIEHDKERNQFLQSTVESIK
ncbi:hypothetical protein [Pseudomonas baetica]|uniref:hypothetical protein n=1 Tax=Pseudomonas baetica TaxID=674054 RepID=UPI002405B905|nr:hypothetical protein [Pseudomonas baetica]MDF9778819.1 hypothetical protein [Pseudomonas baetica]